MKENFFDKPTMPNMPKNPGRIIFGIIIFIIAVLFISQGWYTVSEQEKAVLTTAGKITDTRDAGLHFKIPILQRATKVDTTTQRMTIGYIESGGQAISSGDNLMISNDFNIVSIDFYVEWNVVNPAKFLYAAGNPVSLLYNVFQSSARDIVSAYPVDSVMTDGRSEVETNIQELVMRVLEVYDIGVRVTNVVIMDAEPPTAEVNEAFKSVESARQKRDTMLNEANKYYNENIPLAEAEKDRLIREAEAVKEARINEANGQTARFNKMFDEYQLFPEITRTRMYLETVEEIMPGMKTYIDGTDGGDLLKLLNLNQ